VFFQIATATKVHLRKKCCLVTEFGIIIISLLQVSKQLVIQSKVEQLPKRKSFHFCFSPHLL